MNFNWRRKLRFGRGKRICQISRFLCQVMELGDTEGHSHYDLTEFVQRSCYSNKMHIFFLSACPTKHHARCCYLLKTNWQNSVWHDAGFFECFPDIIIISSLAVIFWSLLLIAQCILLLIFSPIFLYFQLCIKSISVIILFSFQTPLLK